MSANRVRIIGGAWRSRLVRFPSRKDLRPTPDRVRETVFNWLGQDLTGCACLDLFAGSGALGLEAASRGAQRVVLVDRDREVCGALTAARDELGADAVEVRCADALEFLRGVGDRYDVIFLDPPFKEDHWASLMPLLPRCIAPGGFVYRESGAQDEVPTGWTVHRQSRAGQVHFQLLKRTEHEQ